MKIAAISAFSLCLAASLIANLSIWQNYSRWVSDSKDSIRYQRTSCANTRDLAAKDRKNLQQVQLDTGKNYNQLAAIRKTLADKTEEAELRKRMTALEKKLVSAGIPLTHRPLATGEILTAERASELFFTTFRSY